MSSILDDQSTEVPLADIVEFMDEFLQTSTTPDYPNALNGLQFSNSGKVRKLATAVDFSSQTIESARSENASLLLVHHGMFWTGLQPVKGKVFDRFQQLLEADLAVYSSHLPLDRHPGLGNNALLAKRLGLQSSAPFARFQDIFIGVRGQSDVPTRVIIDRARAFSREHGGDTIATPVFEGQRTTHWAICTGAGASAETLDEASHEGVDTLIVGEGPHWTAVAAVERGITVLYIGHYASETLGVRALGDLAGRRFNLQTVTITAPTGL